MNPHILNRDVQNFIADHLEKNLDRTILKGSPFSEVSMMELAQQIESKNRCRKKLPTWFREKGLVFPPRLNIEQASSERAAEYKASLVSGNILADLSGGFGVDSFFFSKRMQHVIHCEIDPDLHTIAKHNFLKLEAENITCVNQDSMDYLKQSDQTFEWIYLDPGRRHNQKDRVFQLEDCSPNILENLDLILSKTDQVLLKLSPFLDIASAIDQLKPVAEVHVLAVDNEVKELLFLLRKGTATDIPIIAVNITSEQKDIMSSKFKTDVSKPLFGPAGVFLYEPNAAILKAGLFNAVAIKYHLTKLHPNSHLYTSDDLIPFPGRRFKVKQQIKYSPKKIKRQLGLTKANISTRNFHESVAQIRKRTGLKEGGTDYLFFTTDHSGHPIVLVCDKAS